MNNYLLESTDEVAIQETIESLLKENHFETAEVDTYDLEITTLEKVLEDLDTYNFFTPLKVVIVKKIESLNYDDNKKAIEHLYKYLANPNKDNLLIVVANKLNNTLKLTKELKKNLLYLQPKINLDDFIKKALKGYELEVGVIKKLEDYCQNDVTKLSNECKKLKDYALLSKKITKEDVTNLVMMKLGDSKDLTFGFVRSLAEKNKKEALKKYKELLDCNIEPIAIIGLTASQIRIMYQVKILEKQALSNKDIANKLGEKSDYRIAKTRELTRFYSEKELLNLMIELEKIDLKAKTQDVDCNFLIDMFVINM